MSPFQPVQKPVKISSLDRDSQANDDSDNSLTLGAQSRSAPSSSWKQEQKNLLFRLSQIFRRNYEVASQMVERCESLQQSEVVLETFSKQIAHDFTNVTSLFANCKTTEN
jgi:hypothetical protein